MAGWCMSRVPGGGYRRSERGWRTWSTDWSVKAWKGFHSFFHPFIHSARTRGCRETTINHSVPPSTDAPLSCRLTLAPHPSTLLPSCYSHKGFPPIWPNEHPTSSANTPLPSQRDLSISSARCLTLLWWAFAFLFFFYKNDDRWTAGNISKLNIIVYKINPRGIRERHPPVAFSSRWC